MSPRLQLTILALVIGVVLLSVLLLIDFPFGYGFGLRRLAVIIAVIFYALLIFIAQKIKKFRSVSS